MDRDVSLTLLADTLVVLSEAPDNALESLIRSLSGNLHRDALEVLANVSHFVSDVDIRRSDDAYSTMQKRQMAGLMAALRRSATRDELLTYSFLR
jgi:hypothetical protein